MNQMLFLYVAAGLIVILLAWIVRLEVKIGRLLRGTKSVSLEDSILNVIEELKELNKFRGVSEKYFANVEQRLRRSVQAVETVRFNPFRGSGEGGNQSFATAFINEHGDGVVISSLNARERLSLFSKPLRKFSSDFELSDEETEVITRARQNTTNA